MPEPASSRSVERRQARPWLDRFRRLCRYRLVIPIKRSPHPPEHTARGVMIGLMWGLTPSVGAQMIFCLITWVIARRFFKWDFSLIVSLAWTWTTNVITLVPAYYLFFITGQLMLGKFDDLSGYGDFAAAWANAIQDQTHATFWESAWFYTVLLFKGWGVPMLIGCIPWSIFGGWMGYTWSLRFIRRHRRRKAEKLMTNAAKQEA